MREFREWANEAERMTHYTFTGLDFGYPHCCIRYFTENIQSPAWESYAANNPFRGTGFIACPVCAKQPVITLAYIQQNRSPQYGTFPQLT